jgi:hypothetical protein
MKPTENAHCDLNEGQLPDKKIWGTPRCEKWNTPRLTPVPFHSTRGGNTGDPESDGGNHSSGS